MQHTINIKLVMGWSSKEERGGGVTVTWNE